jgi:oligoribonuclease
MWAARLTIESVTEITEHLVWIDCEMTGLDLDKDCLVEVAVVITDSELEIVDAGLDVVIKPRPDSLANMGEFVTSMHTESGLINEFDNGLELEAAEQVILEYIKRFVPKYCANSWPPK